MTTQGDSRDQTILIADDEAAIRLALAALLEAEAYHVIAAKNGKEALTLAAEAFPDLILLDVRMPQLDGLEVCRRLRADPRLGGVPIVLVTALSDRDTRLAGLEAGADDFIYKPFDTVELMARVRAMLRFNQYRQRYEEHLRLEADRQQALQELQTQQTELQMQNEELRRTQAELGESRARYFDLYDLAPVGYLTLSEPGLILEANLTAARLLGEDGPALVSQPLARFILPEDQDLYFRHRQHLLRSRLSQTFELRLTRRGAPYFWARVEATAAHDPGGAPVWWRAVISDISARVHADQMRAQAEAALRESEARFRLIAEHAADVIWTLDPVTRRFTYISPAVQRLLGYTAEELMQGPGLPVLLPADWYQRVMAVLPPRLAAFEAGEEAARVAVTEVDLLRKDGSIVPTEVATTLVPNALGRVVEIVGISRDNTERRQAEAKIRKSEEQYRLLVEHLPAGVIVHAADGQVVLSNPKAVELLGLAPEAMRGGLAADRDWQFVREDTSPLPLEDYLAQRVLATGQAVSNQVIGVHSQATGDFRWMLASAFPTFEAQEQVAQAVVLLTDISRRKEAEAALRASETRYRELYHSAQRQAQEMALLDQVRTVVASELDLAAVMRKVVEAVANTYGYPLVSLYLRRGEVMALQHQVGYATVIPEIPLAQGVIGKVIRTGQPVLLGDVHADPDFLEAMPGITSEACVPLFDGGQAVGALNIETQAAVFTDADLRLLAALGEQIGLALARARLYTQVLEDAATKATLLHEVNHRVKNNLSSIIGLLRLEQKHMPAELHGSHRALVGALIGRIQSLADVHDLLSDVGWAPLPLHALGGKIIEAAAAIAAPRAEVTVDIPPSSVQVTAKEASALALILNELATNSLKHALPTTPALCLGLQIRQEAQLIWLEYRDNGPGYPPEVLSGARHNVGLHLIRLLSQHDLRGKIDLSNDIGAVVRITFVTAPPESSAQRQAGIWPLDAGHG